MHGNESKSPSVVSGRQHRDPYPNTTRGCGGSSPMAASPTQTPLATSHEAVGFKQEVILLSARRIDASGDVAAMTVATSLAAPTKMILRESCLIVDGGPYVLIVVGLEGS